MVYQVLYRKYRPKDFSEVVGQEHVVKVISNALRMGRVAHAYLFSGPRGVGKTTIARLIAKAVNCANSASVAEGNAVAALPARQSESGGGSIRRSLDEGGLPIPCNACSSCEIFNRGQALNLIEIDAASNRGIDEIRELREAVRFAPAEGRYKVYIIDEVHGLTRDAANALLKTLEEPPGHAIFVLATTELDKVPETIISRTQHFDFRRPRKELISHRLVAIAKREGITLEPEAADLIAFAAEGSVRDGESLLGKIMAVEDAEITQAEVEEILGIPPPQAIRELSRLIAENNLKASLELVNQLYEQGYEMEYLTKMLISFFRDALVAAMTQPAASTGNHGQSPEALAKALYHLIEALAGFRRTPIPQLPLELAIISIVNGASAN